MAQPKSRLPLMLGLTVAGAGGYYLYSAGGDPKVAEKKIERKSTMLITTSLLIPLTYLQTMPPQRLLD